MSEDQAHWESGRPVEPWPVSFDDAEVIPIAPKPPMLAMWTQDDPPRRVLVELSGPRAEAFRDWVAALREARRNQQPDPPLSLPA